MDEEQRLLARLLSGKDRPSRLEKEAILADVLAGLEPARPRPRWGLAWVLAPAMSAALALFLWFGAAQEPALVARGAASFQTLCAAAATPELLVPSATCPRGAQLAFRAGPSAERPYFAAVARDARGNVVWYVPSKEEGRSVDLRAGRRDGVVAVAASLGPEHEADHYEIYGVYSTEPLDRAAIRAILEASMQGAETAGATVVKRSLSLSE